MTNIAWVVKACNELGVTLTLLGNSEHAGYISRSGKQYFFLASSNCLVSYGLSRMYTDKGYMYELLVGHVVLPQTSIYIDPNSVHENKNQSIDEIVENIHGVFSYPCIIKRGRGMRGQHVYKCNSKDDIVSAIESIFTQDNMYDYVILAQEYIEIQREYRVIVYNNKVQIVYYKNVENAIFQGNISPMYHEGAVTIPVRDERILSDIQAYVDTITTVLQLPYTGMDLAYDKYGSYKLIELNAAPSLAKYVRDNGDEEVVHMYKKIISDLP